MKLIELAEAHNLDQELLQEVCEEDLAIPLPKAMDTDLGDEQVRRILACDGLETVDGEEFAPIIDEGFIEKHKRSQAAKKAAATRKRKELAAREQAEAEKQALIEKERRKHEEALREREAEEEERRKAEEAEEEAREVEEEERRKVEEEAQRIAAEEILARRDEESQRIAEGLAEAASEANQAVADAAEADALAAAESSEQAEAAPDEAEAAPDEADTATEEPEPATTAAASEPVTPAAVAETVPDTPAATAEVSAAPAAEEPAPTASDAAAEKPKAGAAESASPAIEDDKIVARTKGLGSKLANLAKATHEKADHSTKDKNIKDIRKIDAKVGTITGDSGDDKELSDEDRRKIIQDNIRKNLQMQQRVREAKTTDRRRGFKAIDRRVTPGPGGPGGGPGGPGGGPGGPGRGGPGGPGGPGGRRGRGGRRGATTDDKDDKEGNLRGGRRRRPLSTEEEDLSGKKEFTVSIPCTVRDFSEASGLKANVVIAKLFMAGVMANINSTMDRDQIDLLASEFEKEVTIKEGADVEEEVEALHEEDDDADLAPRPPIVTILGHVDHGKTSLLDSIRKTAVTQDEAGGITQHIGAYTVDTAAGMEVTFIDTPGHEAFTEMRARGAQATDVAVIVVAADDGMMPQTIEAINHAKAAEVAIVVAMNKIDKEGADPDKVLRQLAEQGLQAEEWGGEVGVIRTSAITGEGIDELLDRLALESEILELNSNHAAKASGIVIEANLSEGRGVTATLLVQRGTMFAGDVVLAGTGYGRVRNMINWKGDKETSAGPSHAVEIIGLSELPSAGARFHVVESLKTAAEVADQRAHQLREKELAARNTTTSLATLFDDIADSKKQELRVIVKADAAGSLEVLKSSLADLANDEVRVNVIHSGVGALSTGDITLAEASQAVCLGFHVVPDGKARRMAEDKNVEVSSYTIIYELLDDVKKALGGMLRPDEVEKVIGHAEVLQTFKSSKFGTIAGLMVNDGNVVRGAFLRITRDGVILHTGKVDTLRRFKEDVKEVKSGYECGLTIEKFNDIQVGDTFEFYNKEQVSRTL